MGPQSPRPCKRRRHQPVLAAVGYNFRCLLAWLRVLLLRILIALGLFEFFTDDCCTTSNQQGRPQFAVARTASRPGLCCAASWSS
jgi:hypothetical protein